MKKLTWMFGFVILFSTQCSKKEDLVLSTPQNTISEERGGGGNNNVGFINYAVPQDVRWKSGLPTYIFVGFSQPAPSGGWTLTLTSNNANYIVPATYNVPAGTLGIQIPVTTNVVNDGVIVTFTVKLGTQTKTNTVKLFPPTATLPAPQQLAPSNGKSFNFGIQITYDWNDHNNAYYGLMQLSTSNTFPNTKETVTFANFESFFATNFTPGTGTLYWRVAFYDASDNKGPWSTVRTIVVKPQK